MAVGLSGIAFIVAAILFLLAAIPPAEPQRARLVSVGLAFLAAGHVLP